MFLVCCRIVGNLSLVFRIFTIFSRAASTAQFDAILVEFNLRSERSAHPRTGNGLQVIRQLRASEITAPILMFTVMKGELYETASLDAGEDDFILKTTSIPSLISRPKPSQHFSRCPDQPHRAIDYCHPPPRAL
jgi:DNA-binding response OmpR family regulator